MDLKFIVHAEDDNNYDLFPESDEIVTVAAKAVTHPRNSNADTPSAIQAISGAGLRADLVSTQESCLPNVMGKADHKNLLTERIVKHLERVCELNHQRKRVRSAESATGFFPNEVPNGPNAMFFDNFHKDITMWHFVDGAIGNKDFNYRVIDLAFRYLGRVER